MFGHIVAVSDCIYMSEKNNFPRKNHYVPQFYLRGFSQDQENTFRFNKNSNTMEYLPISVVGMQKNLYTFKKKDGTKGTLEKLFSEMEGLAAIAIRKLQNREILTDQQKTDLSYFISCQMVRTPAFQKQMLDAITDLTKKRMVMQMQMTKPEHVQKFFEDKGKIISHEEATEIVKVGSSDDMNKIGFNYPKEYWLKRMLKLAMDIYPVFQICDWEIRHSPTKFGFITSDHPFLLIPGEKPDFFGVGLLTPKVKKILPLTSSMCLIAHEPSENPIMVHKDADKNFFRKINEWTIKNAESYVFSPDAGKVEKMIKLNKKLLYVPKRYSVS